MVSSAAFWCISGWYPPFMVWTSVSWGMSAQQGREWQMLNVECEFLTSESSHSVKGRSWNKHLPSWRWECWAADGVYRQVASTWAFLRCPCSPIADTHYLTCRIQECSETKRSGPFSRSIDVSSLVVQDEYIFIQVRWLPAIGTWILPAQGIFAAQKCLHKVFFLC